MNLFSTSSLPWYMFVMGIWLCITYIIKNIKPVYVIVISIIFGVLVGYDKSVGDFLCFSRVIVFFPYFILGYYLKPTMFKKILEIKKLKWVCILFLGFSMIFIVKNIDYLYLFRGFFTGRNSYLTLNQPIYGGIYRLLAYIITTVISLGVIYITPKNEMFFTILGERTLQIYFLHHIILRLYHYYKLNNIVINLYPSHWKILYICLAILLTFILSLRILEYPFKKIMNINLDKIII